MTTALVDPSTCGEQNPTCFVEAANETLATNRDITAPLGMAQQELSTEDTSCSTYCPKDMASLCSNENIPVTDKLFGDDVDKAIETSREIFKIKSYHSGGQRFRPYKHGQNRHVLRLCVVSVLKEYIRRTKEIRGN